tara:strand:- start:3938 stop:4273 length:336 start_codon:yes stop_codon:yes gene_type:complete
MAETFKNNDGVAVTNSEADLYVCPGSTTAVVISCRVTNIDGAADDTVSVKVTQSNNTNMSHLAKTITVPADSTLELAGQSKIVLEAGEKLRIQGAASSGDLEAFVSVLEIT